MRRPSSLALLFGMLRGAILAVAMAAAGGFAAHADWYDDREPDTHDGEVLAQLDPTDTVPQIDHSGCGWRFERCDGCNRRFERCDGFGPPRRPPPPPPPVLPGSFGHPTLLVDCGAPHSEPRRGVFNSVDQAADFAPPNATILILPPGQGTTCYGPVFVHKPVTISTYGVGGDERAVIQAPPGAPCIRADIALGDALIIDNVRFIARGGRAPCVSVEAGRVVARHVEIDSRTTNWAFDVRESGELTVESSRIETDRSGLRAWRATVNLRDVTVDIGSRHVGAQMNLTWADCTGEDDPQFDDEPVAEGPPGGPGPDARDRPPAGALHRFVDDRDVVRGAIGLSLQCTDGAVDAVSVNGGEVGILASSGTHGLFLTDDKVRMARTGLLLLRGQVGPVTVQRATLSRNSRGIIVSPGAESEISGSVITDSADFGISVYGTDTLISGNKIINAGYGVQMLPATAFPPGRVGLPPPGTTGELPAGSPVHGLPLPNLTDLKSKPRLYNDPGAKPIVENNLIANVRFAAVRIDSRADGESWRMHGRVIGNTFYARGAKCFDDEFNEDPVETRSNTCNKSWFSWPF